MPRASRHVVVARAFLGLLGDSESPSLCNLHLQIMLHRVMRSGVPEHMTDPSLGNIFSECATEEVRMLFHNAHRLWQEGSETERPEKCRVSLSEQLLVEVVLAALHFPLSELSMDAILNILCPGLEATLTVSEDYRNTAIPRLREAGVRGSWAFALRTRTVQLNDNSPFAGKIVLAL